MIFVSFSWVSLPSIWRIISLCHFYGGNDSSFLHTDRPIASIAFHAQGELLAVASGHKVSFLALNFT